MKWEEKINYPVSEELEGNDDYSFWDTKLSQLSHAVPTSRLVLRTMTSGSIRQSKTAEWFTITFVQNVQ